MPSNTKDLLCGALTQALSVKQVRATNLKKCTLYSTVILPRFVSDTNYDYCMCKENFSQGLLVLG